MNLTGWAFWIAERDIRTEKALAACLRISETDLWRVRKGHSQPGTKFIRHAQLGLDTVYTDLFLHETAA